jgi:hypothetical protein
VAWLGIVLIVAGFVTMAPRGATPGGAAHRNVPLGSVMGGLVETPGYQNKPEDDSRRSTVIRVIAGLVLLAGGLIIVIIAF